MHAAAFSCGKDRDPGEMRAAIATANPGSVVQAVRGFSGSNELLVEMLAAQTLNAEASGRPLARKPEIDLLLRLAGTTQIAKAMGTMGVKAGAPFLLVVASRAPIRKTKELEKIELPRRPLTRSELAKIEKSALLDALRA